MRRRRLPAGLRSRLLIALLATSAVTLGVAALVVLPPLQDRLRDQTVETVEDAVSDHAAELDQVIDDVGADKPLRDYYTPLFAPVRALQDQSSARVLILHTTLQSSDPDGPSPAFLYDSEFGSSYISDGSAACRLCPVCQLIAWLRSVNPESLDQLGHAAGSMLHALSGLVDAAHRSGERRGSPVEKINLADDTDDGPEETPWR